MKNKDFKELLASVKEGGKMVSRVSDERLQELIDTYGFYVGEDYQSITESSSIIFMEYKDSLISLKEVQRLRKQNKLLIEYAPKYLVDENGRIYEAKV